MACGCSKNKKAASASRAARIDRVVYQPSTVSDGLASEPAKMGNAYRAVRYLVAPKEAIAAGELAEAEVFTTLANARSRVRQLGIEYGVKTTRTQ